jgi:hypothetical protein
MDENTKFSVGLDVHKGVGKDDLIERAVFDLFRVGRGFATP